MAGKALIWWWRSRRYSRGRWAVLVVGLLVLLGWLSHKREEHIVMFIVSRSFAKSIHFAWNKAFVAASDVVNAFQDTTQATEFFFSEAERNVTEQFARSFYLEMARNDIAAPVVVYLATFSVPLFVRHCLKNLPLSSKRYFVIVSGSMDFSPGDVFKEPWGEAKDLEFLLENPRLRRWFAQNCDVDHEKMTCLPIGVDYHTRSVRRINGEAIQTELAQDDELFRASKRARLGDFMTREPLMLMDFSLNTNVDLRARLYWRFHNAPFAHVMRFSLPRSELWGHYAHVRFVLSPPGNGYDCHRTWEALALGSVPIVLSAQRHMRSEKANELFRDLPVVIVDSFDQISAESMQSWAVDISSRMSQFDGYNMEKLEAAYWIRRFRQ